MNIDFSKPLVDMYGTAATEMLPGGATRPLTVGSVCATALVSADGQAQLPAAAKIARYRLAMLLVGGGDHDLAATDLAMISGCVTQVCGILAVGQVVPLLEGGDGSAR